MEYFEVDYDTLGAALMNAESKEAVMELFINCCRLNNEISAFRLDDAHPSVKTVAEKFGLDTNVKAANVSQFTPADQRHPQCHLYVP